ncbi:MAG: helix-turn-helix transcriptional regulator [Candidatus Bathyarchaeia archaeon]
MKTDDLKRIILIMFKGNDLHGYEVHKRLESQSVEVEMSRLYRILNEMLKDGLLESLWQKSQIGPKKRVYRLGKNGEKELDNILEDAIETIHIFYSEYLLNLPPEASVFNHIGSYITEKLKNIVNIVYFTPIYSTIIEKSLLSLRSSAPLGNIHLVKPRSVETNLQLDNLSILDGEYWDIPLKEGYADLEVITYLPKSDSIQAAMREWCRVLKKSGTLAILIPTVNINNYEDPLTIGDFVEKHERENIREKEYADKKTTLALLRDCFENVEEKNIVHMTVLRASGKKIFLS